MCDSTSPCCGFLACVHLSRRLVTVPAPFKLLFLPVCVLVRHLRPHHRRCVAAAGRRHPRGAVGVALLLPEEMEDPRGAQREGVQGLAGVPAAGSGSVGLLAVPVSTERMEC